MQQFRVFKTAPHAATYRHCEELTWIPERPPKDPPSQKTASPAIREGVQQCSVTKEQGRTRSQWLVEKSGEARQHDDHESQIWWAERPMNCRWEWLSSYTRRNTSWQDRSPPAPSIWRRTIPPWRWLVSQIEPTWHPLDCKGEAPRTMELVKQLSTTLTRRTLNDSVVRLSWSD